MKFYKINPNNPKEVFEHLGCEKAGASILNTKSRTNLLLIKDLKTPAANILKQDALSIGADLAVPRGTIVCETPTVDCVLIGTDKHFEILAKKGSLQPFGLKNLAKELKNFTRPHRGKCEIMGVINANEDSFFDKSRFQGGAAIAQMEQMIADGATIIDIGGVSTRPNSVVVDPDEELRRIVPICDWIKEHKIYERVMLSIDSFTPCVIEYALQSGFGIINDITGLQNDVICELASKYKATVVIMHMQGVPQTMQNNPHYEDVMVEVDQFFRIQIAKAHQYGIEDIILDVGIGFGKTTEHNLTLLRNLEHFTHFGYPLLLGASRKSLIEQIVPNTPIEARLPATIAIHLDGLSKGASIIRCHDVKEHYQAIKVFRAIEGL